MKSANNGLSEEEIKKLASGSAAFIVKNKPINTISMTKIKFASVFGHPVKSLLINLFTRMIFLLDKKNRQATKTKKANKLSDASTMIELEIELEKLHLKGVKDFCNGKVSVLDKYEIMKLDHELCMLMGHKNHTMSYA